MNIHDALRALNLTGKVTIDEIKTAYRTQIRKYHPDVNPAGLEMSQVINAAYNALKETGLEVFEGKGSLGYDALLNDAINAVLGLEGIEIEICGIWVWLAGDTKTHKEALKQAGYRWAGKKKRWYFRPEEYRSYNRGKFSMNKIREMYGSAHIDNSDQKKRIANA